MFIGALAGCERVAADRADAQLVARVNGIEISARQVRTGAAASVAQAVEKIIDRELLVQKALEAGLERDPLVKDTIDNARRQVLAQAYIERVARTNEGGAAKPSRDEVRAFYNDNPALFAQRRIYRMRELVVSAPAEMIDVLRAQAARASELDELASWLKSRNARFSVAIETQPAEQLPLAYLPQLARMKTGDIAVFTTPASAQVSVRASVVQLIHAEPAPLGIEQASALIEQFLAGRRRLEIASAEVKRLREGARIEYVAQFKR